MPTLVSSASLWFSQIHRRWLCPSEIPALQGFPSTPALLYGKACCSFATRPRGQTQSDCDWPSRQAVFRMFGNSMHVHVAAVVLMYVWSQIEMDSDILLFMRDLNRRRCLSMSGRQIKRSRNS